MYVTPLPNESVEVGRPIKKTPIYSAHHLGYNKNERENYKGHKYYKDTIYFCENWDQKSFDPNFKSLTLKDFEPYVIKIFSREPYTQ